MSAIYYDLKGDNDEWMQCSAKSQHWIVKKSEFSRLYLFLDQFDPIEKDLNQNPAKGPLNGLLLQEIVSMNMHQIMAKFGANMCVEIGVELFRIAPSYRLYSFCMFLSTQLSSKIGSFEQADSDLIEAARYRLSELLVWTKLFQKMS